MSNNYRPRRYNDNDEYVPHSARSSDSGSSGGSGSSYQNSGYSQGYSQQYNNYSSSQNSGSYGRSSSQNSGSYSRGGSQYGSNQYSSSQRYSPSGSQSRQNAQYSSAGSRYAESRKTVTNDRGDRYEVHEEYVTKRSGKKPAFSTSKGCASVAIYMAIITAVSILLSFYIIVGVNDMFALKKEEVTVQIEVPKDASLNQISKLLKDNGVIDYPSFFKIFAKITMDDDDKFKHGTYQISTKSDYKQIVKKLTNPSSADRGIVKVTFPEGANILQYAELLEDNNVCTKEAFLKSVNEMELDYSFLSSIKFGEGSDRIYRLEGYLFPNTYDFYINEGSKSAIKKMLNSFKENYTRVGENSPSVEEVVKESGMTLDQILTIASIIERETPDPNEMANVASVFRNRLKNKSEYPKLQSDATRWYPYATKKDVPADQLETFKSKYDTTVIDGLMPGPICNPGIKSIIAAAKPADTKYYFFYTDKNGKHYYASTYEEHQKNVKYCQDNGLAG